MLMISSARVRWVIRPRVIVYHETANKYTAYHHNAHRDELKDDIKTLFAAERCPRNVSPSQSLELIIAEGALRRCGSVVALLPTQT